MTLEDETLLLFSSPKVTVESRRIAQLSVVSGRDIGRHYAVGDDTLLGRGQDCAIRLEHPGVSRHHARIVRANEVLFTIEDLGSRNGTRVNGQSIRSAPLQAGDRVQIGPQTTLLFSLRDLVEEQLIEAQKMVAIGRLSAGITHDFNNLLSILCANIDFLQQLDPGTALASPDVRESLAELATATQRATDLTRRLARVVRGDSEAHGPLNLSELCREVARLVRRLLPQSIRIDTKIEDGLFIEGSPSRIHQLLMNPCINARDAMPQGGTLTISVRRGAPSHPPPNPVAAAEHPPDSITLEIRDTGVGMDPATLERAFEPFFTTKGPQLGTGLGLSTLLTVAREHGGQAQLQSALGEGTTVRIVLPALTSTAPTHHSLQPAALTSQRSDSHGLVLVVDDDRAVARSAERLLQSAGHSTLYAEDGEQALQLLACTQATPRLILLDLDMPRMNGRECLRRLMARGSAPAVVCMSGKTMQSGPQQVLEQGALAFLHKPLTAAGLRHALAIAGLAS